MYRIHETNNKHLFLEGFELSLISLLSIVNLRKSSSLYIYAVNGFTCESHALLSLAGFISVIAHPFEHIVHFASTGCIVLMSLDRWGQRSMSMSVCLYVCASVRQCVCAFVHQWVCASARLCICATARQWVCASARQWVCASVHQWICASVSLCICASVRLCVSESVHLCVWVSMCLCVSVSKD